MMMMVMILTTFAPHGGGGVVVATCGVETAHFANRRGSRCLLPTESGLAYSAGCVQCAGPVRSSAHTIHAHTHAHTHTTDTHTTTGATPTSTHTDVEGVLLKRFAASLRSCCQHANDLVLWFFDLTGGFRATLYRVTVCEFSAVRCVENRGRGVPTTTTATTASKTATATTATRDLASKISDLVFLQTDSTVA